MPNIYRDPQLYDAAHWWKTNDIKFIADWADKAGSPVLELAAGTGRLAIPILEKGHHYTGLELSAEYVKWAEDKLDQYGSLGYIIRGDIREFDLGEKFQFIFIGFNSLFHLYSDKEILSCFKNVRKHLSETGTFLIDCFVPDPIFLYRDERLLYNVMEFDHPDGEHYQVKEMNEYDPETQINHIWWYFFRDGKKKPDLYEFDMNMIFPDTMDRLLMEAGLEIKEKWGEYDGSAFDVASRLQIYICGK